jgi:uncharacterized protein YecT (DUF1311 family)
MRQIAFSSSKRLVLTAALLSWLATTGQTVLAVDICFQADTGNQVAMNQCSAQRLQLAEKELSVTYQKMLDHFGPKKDKELQYSQQAWLKYRDAQCAFEESFAQGGSLAPMLLTDCQKDMTQKRTKRLKNIIQDFNVPK